MGSEVRKSMKPHQAASVADEEASWLCGGCSTALQDHEEVYCWSCKDYFDHVHDDYFKCPTCKGTGTVNPLTAPDGFFCAASTECPHCDGTGEI